MHVLIVSPYHGGSHRSWAVGYQRHSRHQVALTTLPARFWKWRMHGGAVTLARRFLEMQGDALATPPELILATDMLDLTTFLALTRRSLPPIPVVLYMHENQLTYPLPANPDSGPMRRQRGERDLHYVFINYASMLAADRILFNSHYHRDSLLEALPRFLGRFPEYKESGSLFSLRERSAVMPVGLDLDALGKPAEDRNERFILGSTANDGPLLLWNQRWEYDKNPAAFFDALYQLQAQGIPFRLAICGERFSRAPDEFEKASTHLAEHIVHFGFADRETYRRLLWSADVVVSTALHEFFGISVLEAIYCQTFPILPARLSYPELLPKRFHVRCLYEDQGGLLQQLRWALQHTGQAGGYARELATSVEKFSWQRVAQQYDSYLCTLAEEHSNSTSGTA